MLKYKKEISIVLLVLWMSVIYFFSSQNGTASASLSNGLLFKIATFFNVKDYEAFLMAYATIFRKFAHFSEFFILGVLMYNCFRQYSNKVYIVCIILCILYAISDECHQLFIDDRAFSIIDISIDSLGSFLGISFLHLVFSKCYQEKKH